MAKGNLSLVKPDAATAVPVPTDLSTSRRGADLYVDNKDMCKDHNYRGQGWPSSSVRNVDFKDGESIVDGCAKCYQIWRLVHINPGKENAGE